LVISGFRLGNFERRIDALTAHLQNLLNSRGAETTVGQADDVKRNTTDERLGNESAVPYVPPWRRSIRVLCWVADCFSPPNRWRSIMLSKKLAYTTLLIGALPIVALVVLPDARAASTVAATPTVQVENRGLCYHTDPSDWTCPDSLARFTADSRSLTKVSITLVDKSGRSQTMDLPGGTDAIFLSSNAVKNFLMRYYRDTKQTAKLRALTAYVGRHAQ
jgi:hypothetical protein